MPIFRFHAILTNATLKSQSTRDNEERIFSQSERRRTWTPLRRRGGRRPRTSGCPRCRQSQNAASSRHLPNSRFLEQMQISGRESNEGGLHRLCGRGADNDASPPVTSAKTSVRPCLTKERKFPFAWTRPIPSRTSIRSEFARRL